MTSRRPDRLPAEDTVTALLGSAAGTAVRLLPDSPSPVPWPRPLLHENMTAGPGVSLRHKQTNYSSAPPRRQQSVAAAGEGDAGGLADHTWIYRSRDQTSVLFFLLKPDLTVKA